MSLGRGRGPRGDDEWCLVISSSWEPAPMSSSTTSALSRQPLTQVLRNITDPRNRRGVRHNLSTVLSQGAAKSGQVLGWVMSLMARFGRRDRDLVVEAIPAPGPWTRRMRPMARLRRAAMISGP